MNKAIKLINLFNQTIEEDYKERVPPNLLKLYFDITGAGEEKDYYTAYKKIIPYLRQAVEGGSLKHLRPKNGIMLYRGEKRNISQLSKNTARSYSKSKETAKFFGGRGGVIKEIIVTTDLPAIDFGKVYRGALAKEVIVLEK